MDDLSGSANPKNHPILNLPGPSRAPAAGFQPIALHEPNFPSRVLALRRYHLPATSPRRKDTWSCAKPIPRWAVED